MPGIVSVLSGGKGQECRRSFGITKARRSHVYGFSSPVRSPQFQMCASDHRNTHRNTYQALAQESRKSSVDGFQCLRLPLALLHPVKIAEVEASGRNERKCGGIIQNYWLERKRMSSLHFNLKAEASRLGSLRKPALATWTLDRVWYIKVTVVIFHSLHHHLQYNTHRRATLLLCCGIYFPFCSIMRMRSLSKATEEGSEQRLQGSGEECTWTWMDTVEWADSHYCAFAEHRAAQVISAVVSRFALTPPARHPKRSPTKSNESTRKWCKVTGCPHLAAGTGAQTPEAP